MAVSMSATLALPSNPISGAKFTAVVTLTEGGGTNTNLVSIQPYLLTDAFMPAGNVRFGQVMNAAIMGNYSGAAVTISASTSQTFTFECVIDGALTGHAPAQQQAGFWLGVTCQTSDGSVFGTQQHLALSSHLSGMAGAASPAPNGTLAQSLILGTTTNQYSNTTSNGQLRFDLGANSYLVL